MIGRISLLNASRESTRIFLARAADALSPGEYLVLFFACMPRPGYPPKLTVKADVAGWQPTASALNEWKPLSFAPRTALTLPRACLAGSVDFTHHNEVAGQLN